MSREIKLLPNISAPRDYQLHPEDERAEAQLRPEQYAQQMRTLLAALDETHDVLRKLGFDVAVNVSWGLNKKLRYPSLAIIQKTVKL